MSLDWRLGASVWGFFFGREACDWPTLAEAVASIDASLGVEIWPRRGPEDPPLAPPDEENLTAACHGATFVTFHVGDRCWRWAPDALRAEIDLAARLAARTVVVHPVSLQLDDPSRGPDLPEIRRILRFAQCRSIRIALENTVDSRWALDRAIDEFGGDPEDSNLGICIDVGHAYLSSDAGRHPIRAYLDRYAGQLVHLHLHDTPGEGDRHLAPGRGAVDWSQVVDLLAQQQYRGTAVLEVHDPGNDPREAIRYGLATLRDAVSDVSQLRKSS